jgi:hypothetical protein
MAAYRLNFNGLGDDSHESSNTMPDISLGSLEESFKSPLRSSLNKPFSLAGSSTMTNSSSAVPPKMPSTPKRPLARRGTEEDVKTPKAGDGKNGVFDDNLDDDEGDRKWESDNLAVSRLARTRGGAGAAKAGVNMTLREQEKVSTLV